MPPTRPLSYMLSGGISAPSYRNSSYPPVAPQSTFDYGGVGTHPYYLGPQQHQTTQDLLVYQGPFQQQQWHGQCQTEYGFPTGHHLPPEYQPQRQQQQATEYTHSYASPHQPQQTQWQHQQAAYIHLHASPHLLPSMYQHSQLQQGQWQQEHQSAKHVNPSNWRYQPLPEYESQPLREFAPPQTLMPQEFTPAPQELTPSQEPTPPQELTPCQMQITPSKNQGASENPVLDPASQIATTSAHVLLTVFPVAGSASSLMRKSKLISMNMSDAKPKKTRTKKQSTDTVGKRTNKKSKIPGKFRCSGPDPECLKQTFMTVTDLNRHLKRSAKHVPPVFRCYYPECSQSRSNHYVRSDSLLRHLRLDHPDDPYTPEVGRRLAAEAGAQYRAQNADPGMTPDI